MDIQSKAVEGTTVALLRARQIPRRHGAREFGFAGLWMRGGLVTWSAMLCLFGVWLLAAELTRPTVPFLPSSSDPPNAAEAPNAAAAARIGWLRGDLWLDDALLRWSAILPPGDKARPQAHGAMEAVRSSALRAVRLAPLESRSWLVLSAANAALGREFGPTLKMSYYTGPNELALVPWRVHLTVRAEPNQDSEMKRLTERDLETMIGVPELRPGLVSAFRAASGDGRLAIEAFVAARAPEMLKDFQVQPGVR